jgi:hypothetical protein
MSTAAKSTFGDPIAEPLRGSRGDSRSASRKSLRGASPLERIEAMSIPEPNSGCWLWLASCNGRGRPSMSIDGRTVTAARAALESRLGRKMRSVTMARHTCDVDQCVNPDHLIPGGHLANMRDRSQRNRVNRIPGRKRLTVADADAIRAKRARKIGTRSLAREYQVSEQQIRRICNGTCWPQNLAAE